MVLACYGNWPCPPVAKKVCLVQEPGRPEHEVLFLLDEFAQLGRFSPVEDGISVVRGYGGRFWILVQDLSQLRALYPTDCGNFPKQAERDLKPSWRTTDEVVIHIDTSQKQVMGHEAWYVAVTRARDNLAVFTDSREKLPKVISQVLAKESAIEAVEKSQEKGRGFEIER